jgi:hypothetical protein
LLRFDLSRVRQRLAFRLTLGLGGLAAILVSTGLHIFEARSKNAVPALAAATPIEAGQWLVALSEASIGATMPDGRPAPQGQRAITVETEMTNRTSATSSDFYSLLRLERPAFRAAKPMLYLDRDKALLAQLHPGLTEKVAVVWTVPADQPPPGVVTIAVEAKTFKPRDNLYAAPGWFNEHAVGTVDLPVRPGGESGQAGG